MRRTSASTLATANGRTWAFFRKFPNAMWVSTTFVVRADGLIDAEGSNPLRSAGQSSKTAGHALLNQRWADRAFRDPGW